MKIVQKTIRDYESLTGRSRWIRIVAMSVRNNWPWSGNLRFDGIESCGRYPYSRWDSHLHESRRVFFGRLNEHAS